MRNESVYQLPESPRSEGGSRSENKPHIVVIVPRGEVVRNFLYSETLPALTAEARVSLLSVIHDQAFVDRFGSSVEEIVPLEERREAGMVRGLRKLVHEAHFRWLWSEVARNRWEIWDHRSSSNSDAWDPRGVTAPRRTVLATQKLIYRLTAHRTLLRFLTRLENRLSYRLRPTRDFDEIFARARPTLVFNGSHIHGSAAFLPMRVAHRMGIRTAGFIFSWDNLTSRSRIMEPYDDLLVWNEEMRDKLAAIYPEIPLERILVTGTPQFDFHFKPQYWLAREELAARIGFDPARPFILYTTGVDVHFPEEHRTVASLIRSLSEWPRERRPQLVVRTYVKGTSAEMKALAAEEHEDVYFPPVSWDERWFVPSEEDLATYTSLLRECAAGINAASTVSLELLMHDKPVINLAFDPPGSNIPHPYRWSRHLAFDHYQPVATSGAVMVAKSPDELIAMVCRALERPEEQSTSRKRFIAEFLGSTLDGKAGKRVAERLLALAREARGVGGLPAPGARPRNDENPQTPC